MSNKKLKVFILFLFIFGSMFLYYYVVTSNNSQFNQIQIIPSSLNDNNLIFISSSSPDQKIGPNIRAMLESLPGDTQVSIVITLAYQPSKSLSSSIKENEIKASPSQYEVITKMIKNKVEPIQDRLLEKLIPLGFELEHKIYVSNMIVGTIQLSKIEKIAEIPEVERIEYDMPIKAKLNISVPAIYNHLPYSPWNSSTYDGTGIVVAVLDTGIYEAHPGFEGCVIDRQNFVSGGNIYDDNGHGTHVAGIITSRHATYTGVATNVSLLNVKVLDNHGDGNSGDLIAGAEWAVTSASQKADILSFSGGAIPFQSPSNLQNDGQDFLSLFVDAITTVYDVLWVCAAGNEGEWGSNMINIPGDAYNCLTVGNINDGGNIARFNDFISSKSSTGPTIDGRIKPDLVAPGVNIESLYNDGGTFELSGTSMSTPHVSGAAACLYEYLETVRSDIQKSYYPLVAKASLIYTAQDKGSDGPDGTYGYGYLDMAHLNDFLDNEAIAVGTMDSESVVFSRPVYYRFSLSSTSNFSLTMTWYRHVNYVSSSLLGKYGDGTANNFDVFLYNYTSGELLASSTDTKNNIEQISHSNLAAGDYFIKILQVDTPQYYGAHPFAIASSTALTSFSPSVPQFGATYIGPMFDVNFDYYLASIFYSQFRTTGLNTLTDTMITTMQSFFYPYDSFERLAVLVQVSDPDGISNGMLRLAGNEISNFSFISLGNGYYLAYTEPLSSYVPASSYLNLFFGGVTLECRMTFTDNSVFGATTSYDFYVAIRGFFISLPVYGIILLVLIFVIDYIRTRRAKKMGNVKLN
ncbi:MAG: S8 family serine peptidase [Candidatus Helarchaeales archaeon]